MPRPSATDAASFHHHYISLVNADNVQQIINTYAGVLKEFYSSLPDEKADHAYASDKWTIKELLQHVIDAERIFCYRALRFARKDAAPLPGFDENSYAANSMAGSRTLSLLKEEFNAVRTATDLFLQSLNAEQLTYSGTASNHYITVNAIVFIIYGHLLHHKNILEERYL